MTMDLAEAVRHADAGPLLDRSDLEAFARDGFVVKRGLFDTAETAAILRWTEELAAAPEIPGRHAVYYEPSLDDPDRRVVQRIEDFCRFHTAFDNLARFGVLSAATAALMGKPTVLFKEKINFKLPGADGFKAHQDQAAGWTRYAPLFVTALVSIDPSTRANGCLELVAGRHREGLMGAEWAPLDETGLGLQPVETAPGDVIFFDSFVPHASKANHTAEPRRILYFTYNSADQGDHRLQYFAEKRAAFPPDIERDGTKDYVFRV